MILVQIWLVQIVREHVRFVTKLSRTFVRRVRRLINFKLFQAFWLVKNKHFLSDLFFENWKFRDGKKCQTRITFFIDPIRRSKISSCAFVRVCPLVRPCVRVRSYTDVFGHVRVRASQGSKRLSLLELVALWINH